MAENVSWAEPKKTFKVRKGPTTKKLQPSIASNTGNLNTSLPVTFSTSSTQPSPALENTGGVKRRNPFSNVNNVEDDKRRRLSDNYFHANSPEQFKRQRVDPSSFSFSKSQPVPETCQDIDQDLKPLSELPLDWSLKNRVTFISTSPWLWSQHLSSVQLASSVTSNVRCLEISKGKHCLDTSATSQFYSNCHYWQFPSLPGVNLFPRFKQTRLDKINLGADIHRAASSEWIHSLQSVYQLVKAGQCPFFYVCTQLFTCLFRAAGVAGSQQILALMTPTTHGLRKALVGEDVEFTQPLRREEAEKDAGDQVEEEEEKECCDSEAKVLKGGADDILESLGIEADSLPGFSTSANALKKTTQSKVVLDGRADSLVYIEGVECQSLLNYLLNAKLSQGPNELPPTILGPVAFPGATLKSLKVKEHTVAGKAGQPKAFQIDVTGPILPHTLQNLTQLSASYCKDFEVKTRSQEDTLSLTLFSIPASSQGQAAFASANLNDCGLSDRMVDKISRGEDRGGKASGGNQDKLIRHIHIKEDKYRSLDDGSVDGLTTGPGGEDK